MQDLGKITIDVVDGEGGGGSGQRDLPKVSPEELARNLVSTFKSVSSQYTAKTGIEDASELLTNTSGIVSKSLLGIAIGAGTAVLAMKLIVSGFKAVYDSLKQLHQFIMDAADEFKDYSPAIAVANMTNEIELMVQKFRTGAMIGTSIAGTVAQTGRIERSLLQIRGYAAMIGSAFLEPILRTVADILDELTLNIPKITETLIALLKQIDGLLKPIGALLAAVPVTQMLGVGVLSGSPIVKYLIKILERVARNTDPVMDPAKANEPFLADLRLMGVRI